MAVEVSGEPRSMTKVDVDVRVREHEKSKSHEECYIARRELKRHIVYKKWADSQHYMWHTAN